MAKHVDYDALITALEAIDVFTAVHDGELVLNAVCMECDSTILRATGAEINAAELHQLIVNHDCSEPAPVVIVDEVSALYEELDRTSITDADEDDPITQDGPDTVIEETPTIPCPHPQPVRPL